MKKSIRLGDIYLVVFPSKQGYSYLSFRQLKEAEKYAKDTLLHNKSLEKCYVLKYTMVDIEKSYICELKEVK